MNTVLLLVLVVFYKWLSSNASSTNVSSRPDVVNVGAVFSFSSTVGRVAKVAIEAALEDVNADPSVIGGTKLKIQMQNTNFSGFLGIVETLRFMESDTVAIIGPQSSTVAHVVSHIANELHVPLLSFSASDPTLSSLQYPFFVRTTQNDLFQMSAISEIVEYYGWREVIAIYLDNDQGRNGIATLGDKLAEKRCKISYKAPLPPAATREDITDALVKVALTESRILVIHAHSDWGLDVFSVAQYLGMMGTGYVWIATNWLSTILDTNPLLPDSDAMDKIQGVLTLRMYTPDSELKRKFVGRWGNLTSSKTANVPVGLSTYGLYAYDTVWLLAHAINGFLNQGGNISFSNDSRLADLREGNLHLDAMSIFNGGNLLLHNILHVNMSGITGQIKFNSDGSLINPAYEVINVIGGTRRIGYWSNYSGLSLVTPENLYAEHFNRSSTSQKLYDVIWPGQSTQKPRGWVFPNNGRHLRIGVPNRVSFREFVSLTKDSADMFSGYCVDVFTAAINLLPYAVPYKLLPFGEGHNNPSATELVRLITAGVYDAAIGDIAIITNRTRMVDFTQPYVESGLVVVAPVRKLNSNALAFLRPFTKEMWGVTAIFFIVVGAVVWILEHRINDDFRGPPRKQFVTVLWFSLSTMFFAHKENTVSALGRLVLIIWLFVVLIINSSYTASLTSILTVQKLSSPIKGIQTLKESNDPIGYQQGSFTRNYLIEELNIRESRLVALKSGDEYAKALNDGPQKGGVAAVVDERAYIELFLSTRCEFSIVGQEFTKNGWGFAFPRDSPLAVDLSTAILKLSENGDLERIHDKWLLRTPCSLQGAKLEVDRLQLESFWGLFVICGCACLLALFIFFLKIVRQFSRHSFEEAESSNRGSTSARLQTFLSFVDEKEEEVKIRSKRRQMEMASSRSMDEGESMNESKRRHIEFSSSKSFNAGYEA